MSFLELKNLAIGYREPLILSIDAELSLGEVCLLVGNNGIGKTTLMRTILGQIPPMEGQIWIKETEIKSVSPEQIPKWIYYPYYFKLNSDDLQEVEEIIDSLNLTSYKDFPLKKLSDGNLQKAFIGRALAQNTPMIILDEPTTYLDEENKMMILNLLKKLAKEKNKAILFSSHDWRLAKDFSDKIWWLKDHRLKIGRTPKDAVPEGADSMEKVFWFVK